MSDFEYGVDLSSFGLICRKTVIIKVDFFRKP